MVVKIAEMSDEQITEFFDSRLEYCRFDAPLVGVDSDGLTDAEIDRLKRFGRVEPVAEVPETIDAKIEREYFEGFDYLCRADAPEFDLGGDGLSDAEQKFLEDRIEADNAARKGPGGFVPVTNTSLDTSGLHRSRHCGRFTMQGVNLQETKYLRVNCKCWDCRHCGPRKAKQYRRSIARAAEAYRLFRFVTLTLDPKIPCVDSKGEETSPVRYIKMVWARLRTALKKRFKQAPKFISVMEFQKNTGMPHLHIIIDRYIEQAWMKRAWMEAGGGEHVDIRGVSMRAVSHYLTKYLTKELLCSAPKRSRRVTVSRGITLNEKPAKTHTWSLIWRSIYVMWNGFGGIVDKADWDADLVLWSFSINSDSTRVRGEVLQSPPSGTSAVAWRSGLFENNCN